MSEHGYGWEDLRRRPLAELAIGDTWVVPGEFAAWRESDDGHVRGTFGYEGPRGTAWTLTARDGDRVTARSHDGREVTDTVQPGEQISVLAVVPGATS